MKTVYCTPIYNALMALVVSPKPSDPLYSLPSNQSAFRGWLDSRQTIFDINRQMLTATNTAYTKGVDKLLSTVDQSPWHEADPSSPTAVKAKNALSIGTEFRKWVKSHNQLFQSTRNMTSTAKRFGMTANLSELLKDKKSISQDVIDSSEGFDRSLVEFISRKQLDHQIYSAVKKAFDDLRELIAQI
jgi:hypothetical protein